MNERGAAEAKENPILSLLKPDKRIMSLSNVMRQAVIHWPWFLLSMIICLALALLYVHYTTPAYEISGRIIIKKADTNNIQRRSRKMLGNFKNIGTVTNTLGVENEMEMFMSSVLLRDVVTKLKLYTDYKVEDWPKARHVYGTQPVSVDLDPVHLDSLDRIAYDEFFTIIMKMKRLKEKGSPVGIDCLLLMDDEPVWGFNSKLKSLPAHIKTPFGTLAFTKNPRGEPLTDDREWTVTITPPLYSALLYLGRIKVEAASDDHLSDRFIRRYFYKMSSIIKVSVVDQDKRRGMDFIRQLVASYNHQANEEKNEVSLRTEAFIMDRLNELGKELGDKDLTVEGIKRQSGLTQFSDASLSVTQSDLYANQLTDAATQTEILNYLHEYVADPNNQYQIIPSNIGMTDGASINLIKQYNQTIQDRNRILKSTSTDAPQAQTLTARADELHNAIQEALKHALHNTGIQYENVLSQYSDMKGNISRSASVERMLKETGRQQMVKSKLYLLLLQKREENAINLASVAENGRLIDEPLYEGQVRPKLLTVFGVAGTAGILIPYALLTLAGLLRYKIRDAEELAELTELPIIASVTQMSNKAKGKAGIVVEENRNEPIDEMFRTMRTNLFFMLKPGENTILFTSSTSGEGKTFCAANLAVSYATLGKRVILCGLDIRKPALGQLFGLSDSKLGITPLLSSEHVTREMVMQQIQPSGINGQLDLLLAGPVPPNPTEILARDSFGQVIAILKETYDYVILDTAPVGLVTDTLIIARHADLSIYVCRAYYTPRYAFGQLNKFAEEGMLPNPSIVINGLR